MLESLSSSGSLENGAKIQQHRFVRETFAASIRKRHVASASQRQDQRSERRAIGSSGSHRDD